MNQVNLTGRVTHDLQVKVTKSNKHVLDFQIAVRENKDETIFIRCQAWEKTADIIDQYATKGSNLAISGSLKVEKYQDKNGNNVEKTYVRVSQVEVLDHRKGDLEKKNEEFGYSVEDENKNFSESLRDTEYARNFSGSQDVDIKPGDLPFY